MFKRIAHSFLDLLYPPLCLHCGESIAAEEPLFCASCLEELVLIDPAHRCPFCFQEHEMATLSACLECRRHPPIFNRLAAACDELGPAKTLLARLKSRPALAKGAGALMAAQFLKLEWPFPDLIVPVPLDWIHALERGYNQSQLLADGVGAILQRPVDPLLKRKCGGYTQTLLSRTQREALERSLFSIKSGTSVQGKTVLLIDDSLTTGTTLRRCAEILLEEEPKAVYGLVFCRGM